MKPKDTNVSFIGLGGMGTGMARTLLGAGYRLTVCNRTPAAAEPLLSEGARGVSTPREAANGADLIISMVGDDLDSRAVWLGDDGVLAGRPSPGAIAVECSTLSLDWIRDLNQACARVGLSFVDCPVTGGRAAAAAGTLTLLVGAEEDTLAAARPVLEAMSRRILHFGPVGTATAYKLVVNLMVGVQTAALAEGLALAQRAGLDIDRVLEALTSGAVASPVVKAYARRMVDGEHEEPIQFLSRWLHKDLLYAGELADELEQPVPTLKAATGLFKKSLNQLGPEKNATAVIEILR